MALYYANRELRRKLLAGEATWINKHSRCAYLKQLVLATPDWVDKRVLLAIVKEARRRESRDGKLYAVDHIVPISHGLVCGLNVPWNLRIITRLENAQRSNRWWEWTEDLFAQSEQLRLL
jgi:hypothetical protein